VSEYVATNDVFQEFAGDGSEGDGSIVRGEVAITLFEYTGDVGLEPIRGEGTTIQGSLKDCSESRCNLISTGLKDQVWYAIRARSFSRVEVV
jgi:hypothetical protein